MKPHKDVLVVEIDLGRKSFTKHGMHMRNSGKEKLAEKIASVITNIFLKHEEKISLCWKFENENEDIESVSSTEVNKADTSELVNVDSQTNSDSSIKDIILQKDFKIAQLVTTNVQALSKLVTKDELMHRRNCPAIRNPDFLWT
jgi:hypothetical protein